MVDVTHLLDELHLAIVQVEVSNLAIDELAGDASKGNDGHIGSLSLLGQLVDGKLLLSGQRARHKAGEHSSLLVFLSHLLKSLLLCLLGLGDVLFVGGLDIIGNRVAAVLQTIEQ